MAAAVRDAVANASFVALAGVLGEGERAASRVGNGQLEKRRCGLGEPGQKRAECESDAGKMPERDRRSPVAALRHRRERGNGRTRCQGRRHEIETRRRSRRQRYGHAMRRARSELVSVLRALVLDFGNRDLGLLGLAKAAVSFASWSFAIALGVYGFEVGGAVAVGVVALVRLMPGAIAAPFAGLLGDRLSTAFGPGRQLPRSRAGPCHRHGGCRPRCCRGADLRAGRRVHHRQQRLSARPRRRCCRRWHERRRSCRPPTSPTAAWTTSASCTAAVCTGVLLVVTSPAVVFGVAALVALLAAILLDQDRAGPAPRIRGRRRDLRDACRDDVGLPHPDGAPRPAAARRDAGHARLLRGGRRRPRRDHGAGAARSSAREASASSTPAGE